MTRISAVLLFAATAPAQPALAGQSPTAAVPIADAVLGPRLPDEDLARETGKFILPNGASLALSVTSDTIVNGVAVLRTVLTVDEGSRLQVFGRGDGAPVQVARTGGAPAMAPTGVNVLFDRQSGTRSVTPTFSVGVGSVGTGAVNAASRIGPATDAGAAGLTPLALQVGGPAVRTPDGTVTLAGAAGATQVMLAGDRFGVAHLVGRSVATAITNSANDRTFDTVTSIDIDLRDVSAYTAGAAAMRVDDLALDAARGMVR